MKKLTAFLIDDDHPTNVYNEIMLETSGYFEDWKIFDSATKALETLQSLEVIPDIILLDINMPIMDGWEFIAQYESLDVENKCNCIIMLSTSLSRYDQEKTQDYERIKAFKEKPLTHEVLSDILTLTAN